MQSAPRYYDGRTRSYSASEGGRANERLCRPDPSAGRREACDRQSCGEGRTVIKGKESWKRKPLYFFHGPRLTTLYPYLQIQRQEDDIRARVQVSSQAYHKSVQETQALRQEYFNLRLPQILRVRVSKLPDSAASLTSIFLGFERVRRRNRPRNTIPPHALCFLIRKHHLE